MKNLSFGELSRVDSHYVFFCANGKTGSTAAMLRKGWKRKYRLRKIVPEKERRKNNEQRLSN